MKHADPFATWQHYAALANADAPAARPARQEITVDIHENVIPPFAEATLDRLYCSIYSTLDQFRIDHALAGAHTYVARTGDEIRALLLYRIEGGQATVLNQMITIDGAELARFASALFRRHRELSAILLRPVRTRLRGIPYPVQQHHWAEDIVAALPASNEQYLAALGRNMRETVKRHGNKLARSYPGYRFEVFANEQIDTAQALEVYRLHMARMDRKHQLSHLDERRFRNIVALARTRGMMTLVTIDGRVCAGQIGWRVGSHYVMRVIAHDPQYDDVKLGTLCCYQTIRACIERGASHFHFGGGRLLYKFRLLGVSQAYDAVVVYRSRAALARHPRLAAHTALKGINLELRFWLENAERSDTAPARIACALRQRVRAFRRLLQTLRHGPAPAP